MQREENQKRALRFLINRGGACPQSRFHKDIGINKGVLTRDVVQPLSEEGLLRVKKYQPLSRYVPEYKGKEYRGHIIQIPAGRLYDAIYLAEIPVDELRYKLFLLLLHSGSIRKIKTALKKSGIEYLCNSKVVDLLLKDMEERGWIKRHVRQKDMRIWGFANYSYVKELSDIIWFIRAVSLPLSAVVSNIESIKRLDEHAVVAYLAAASVKASVLLSAFDRFYSATDPSYRGYEVNKTHPRDSALKSLVELAVCYSHRYFDPKKALDYALLPKKANLALFEGDPDVDTISPRALTEYEVRSARYSNALHRVLVHKIGVLTETFSHMLRDSGVPLRWARSKSDVPEVGAVPFEFRILEPIREPFRAKYKDAVDMIIRGDQASSPLGISVWKLLSDEETELKEELVARCVDSMNRYHR